MSTLSENNNSTELSQLELAVYAQNVRANKKTGKSDKIKNNYCPCAKKLACKGDTYEILSKYYVDPKPKKNVSSSLLSNQEPEKIYLVVTSETINGKMKTESVAYARCQNSRGQNQEFCERHTKQGEKRQIFSDFEKKVDGENVILLNDYEMDINGTLQKCPLGHPYFDRMHTKNKELKSSHGDKKPSFEFDSKENKILCVLNHQNKAYSHCLLYCAEYILEHGRLPFDISNVPNESLQQQQTVTRYTIKPVEKNDTTNTENVKEISLQDVYSNLSNNVTTENIQIKKNIKEVEEEEDEESDNESIQSKHTNVMENSENEDSDSDEEEDDDEEEEEFVIEPLFNDSEGTYGKVGKYGVDPKTNTVYFVSEDEEDDTEDVGELYQVNKKGYGKITYQEKPCIIGKSITDPSNDKELILCIWSNKVFDQETMNCLGEAKMKENKDGTKSIKSIKYRSDKTEK